jgi:hypothetical protein
MDAVGNGMQRIDQGPTMEISDSSSSSSSSSSSLMFPGIQVSFWSSNVKLIHLRIRPRLPSRHPPGRNVFLFFFSSFLLPPNITSYQ